MINKKILIITPSLNPKENISGISSFVNTLIDNYKEETYAPFYVGKKDNEKRSIKWLISFIIRPFQLFFFIKNEIKLCHYNLGLEPKSIIRDSLLFFIIKIKRVPIILHLHGGRFMNNESHLFSPLIKYFLKNAKQIIVLGSKEKKWITSKYKISEDKINIIPNSIKIPSELNKKINSENLQIIYLGRIDKKKGLQKIIDAITILDNKIPLKIHICGIGPDLEWMKHSIPQKVSNNFIFHGLVVGENKNKILKNSDIFLLPSDFEGLPISLLESMGLGVIPIVTPVGSIPEVVNNNNGILINNAEDISNAIELLFKDNNLANKLSNNAYLQIKNNFSVSNLKDKIRETYKKVK